MSQIVLSEFGALYHLIYYNLSVLAGVTGQVNESMVQSFLLVR